MHHAVTENDVFATFRSQSCESRIRRQLLINLQKSFTGLKSFETRTPAQRINGHDNLLPDKPLGFPHPLKPAL